MNHDIEILSKKRQKYIEGLQANEGFEDGIKRLLTELYPDIAHFIYELLQNAEDANTEDAEVIEVRFILEEDRAEFEHDGSRLFSIKDVDSITNIGKSAKKDDKMAIGKFGVGFKAVFAYTDSPEIHSGDFHFKITDLVVPEIIKPISRAPGDKGTTFIFPFNNIKKSPEIALREIEKSLRVLGKNTLLFLDHIRKIEYLLPDGSLGYLERKEHPNNRIEILVKKPEKDNEPLPSDYLRFQKTVEVEAEDGELKECRIAVAFKLEKHEDPDTNDVFTWKIVPLTRGQVSIYFPAEKETSNLRFHLHAPFASTVARDSVRDCPANDALRDHIADLIAESMTSIRDQGLLTVDFLATLPNLKDNLSLFYEPIRKKLVDVFKSEDLVPMKKGGHKAADFIFRALKRISDLIDDDDLALILENDDYQPPLWIANPGQLNQREDNFLSSLGVKEWQISELVEKLKSPSDRIKNWLSEKSLKWHQKFYAELKEHYEKARDDEKEQIANLCIIRLTNGSYSIGKECFFPDEFSDYDEMMPRVAKGAYTSGENEKQQENAKKFLEMVDVRSAGEAEQIEMILKNRYSNGDNWPEPGIYFKDLNRFISLVEKCPEKSTLFADYFIFECADGSKARPSDIYLDEPFMKTGLSCYFNSLGDKTYLKPLSRFYEENSIQINQLARFAELVGAIEKLPVEKVSCEQNPKWKDLSELRNCFNSKCSIDVDYNIIGLENLLESPTFEFTRLVWKTMNSLDKECLNAIYKKHRTWRPQNADSQLIHILKNASWIPQNGGEFVKPCDALIDYLPAGFSHDYGSEWLRKIEFGKNTIKQTEKIMYARKLGFKSPDEAEKGVEITRLCRETGKSPDEIISQLKNLRETKPKFPSKKSSNPEQRADKVSQHHADAPEKTYEDKTRSVRTSAKTVDKDSYLRDKYTNEFDEMVCQICKYPMPFKKRNGKFYFEAVEAFSESFSKEYEAQYLALCPVCAAKYKEFIKKDETAMSTFKSDLINADSGSHEVPLSLDNVESSIRFREDHWIDIRTILQIETEN